MNIKNQLVIPDTFAPFVLGRHTFEFRGDTYEYALLKGNEAVQKFAAPQVFTICLNGCLAVSDTFPEQWRELGLLHELYEHGAIDGQKHTCLETLRWELAIAENWRMGMDVYQEFRRQFFAGVIQYYEARGAKTSLPQIEVDLLKGLRESLDFLLPSD